MLALLRTEIYKQTRCLRTLSVFGVVIVIPVSMAIAINNRDHNRPDRGENHGLRLFQLAEASGLVLPAVVLEVMSGLLLVVIVSMFAGDSISGDANSGNLRYLLMRPVSRVKLLFSKVIVSFALTWAVLVVVAASALAIGVGLFGWHPIDLSSFGLPILTTAHMLKDLILATAYVAFGFTALIGAATFFSTLTDSPAGAIGAGVGFYIFSQIMDAVDALGAIRYGFPTHYLDAWQTLFEGAKASQDLVAGVIVQIVWFAMFTVAATLYFKNKDIKS